MKEMLPETGIGAVRAARLMGRLGLGQPWGPSLTQPGARVPLPLTVRYHPKMRAGEAPRLQESSLTSALGQPPEAAPCLEVLFHFSIYHMLLCSLSVQGVDRAIPPLPKQPLGRLASGDSALTQGQHNCGNCFISPSSSLSICKVAITPT